MKYYLLKNDLGYQDRWFLGPIILPPSLDLWTLTGLGPINETLNNIKVQASPGRVLDFTFSDFSIPIINSKVASFLPAEEVQLISIDAGAIKNLSVLMVLNELDCVDERLSDFVRFGENHPVRPDLAGEYELFYKLILNKNECASHSIFKIKGYSQYIIINELIMNGMRDANVKGVLFEEV